jgi:hypothetical protein
MCFMARQAHLAGTAQTIADHLRVWCSQEAEVTQLVHWIEADAKEIGIEAYKRLKNALQKCLLNTRMGY